MSNTSIETVHPETSATLLTPPSVGAPVPPVEAEAMIASTPRHPMVAQRTVALAVSRELRDHPEDAARVLSGLVDQASLANGLAAAAAWSDELARAEAWLRFVRRAELAAWQAPLSALVGAMPVLGRRLASDESRERLPALTHLVVARHEAAVKAARSRAATKAKKEAVQGKR